MGASLATNAKATKDRLVADLRSLVDDADELVRMTATYSGDRVAGARDRLGEKLSEMRDLVERAQTTATGQSKRAAKATNDYVHRYPWRALGIAVGVGVAIGLISMFSARR